MSAGTPTPPFPPNGPGTSAQFDSHDLLLMQEECPPQKLQGHVSALGKELEAVSAAGKFDADVPWPLPEDSPLQQILTADAVQQWDYDLFKLRDLSDNHPLVYMAHGIINLFKLPEKLNLDMKVVHRYLCALERSYNKCIYHNPMHAADVLHATAYILYGKTSDAFPPDELLIIILATCGHDVGHPGINNTYLIKQSHDVASRYSNKSVLENHHASISLALMDQEGMDMLSFLPADASVRRQELKDMLRELVLGTDMSVHMKMVADYQEMITAGKTLDLSSRAERILAMQLVVHSADLSNPGKPWSIHIQWTHAIVAEFFSQGDFERSQGLDISPMCDRAANCGRSSQKNFFLNFCRPLFVIMPKVLPDTAERCFHLVDQMDRNIARWTTLGF